jgi:DNA-binding NarL/FixJ family response regulator
VIGRSPLVGRQTELTVLLGLLDATRVDGGRLVFVTGEPGIGKSRLLDELGARARDAGWLVLAGRAREPERTPPYAPIVEALRPHVLHQPPDRVEAMLGRGAAAVACLLPELERPRPSTLDRLPLTPEEDQAWLFEGVAAALATTATMPPSCGLLLILDDLQWADAGTLLLVRHMAGRLTGIPLLIAGAFRGAEAGRSPVFAPLVNDLIGAGSATILTLDRLTPAESATLVSTLALTPADAAVIEAIEHQTNGNPFHIQQLLRHLICAGLDLSDRATAEMVRRDRPADVRFTVQRQLARMSAAAVDLLWTAAIVGADLSADLLREAVDPEGDLTAALAEAAGMGLLVVEGGRIRFPHDLLREAVDATISPPRRQELHLRAARAFEQMRPYPLATDVTALAVHHRKAGALVDPRVAAEHARRAAEAAFAVCAWHEAAAHWRVALELLEPRDIAERCDLLLMLAETCRLIGDREGGRRACLEAAALARMLDAPERLARAALAFPNTHLNNYDPTHHALLEEALALPPQQQDIHAMLLGRLARVLYEAGDHERMQEVSREALAAGRRTGDARARAHVLLQVSVPLWDLHQIADRLALATDLARAGEVAGDTYRSWVGHCWRCNHLIEMGDRAAIDAAIETCTRLAEQIGRPFAEVVTLGQHAFLALLAGRLGEAESLAGRMRSIGRRTDGEPTEHVAAIQFGSLHARGHFAEAAALLGALPERFRSQPHWSSVLAWLAGRQGRLSEARAVLERLTADGAAAIPRDHGRRATLALLGEIAIMLDDTGRVEQLYAALAPMAARQVDVESVAYLGSVSYYLGRLATALHRWDRASEHIEDAWIHHSRMDARPWLAHTHRAAEEMLLARGAREDRRRAANEIDAALALYRELGMDSWAMEVRALLPIRRDLPDGLTRREAEVLRLIAAGRTNREIAAALVLSVRTVELHVSSIYAKIGVTGPAARVAASSYAMRHSLTIDFDQP